MRWILSAVLVIAAVLGNGLPTGKATAQGYGGWCGYALIEDLPLLENQLSVLAAITPTRSQFSKPNELFQYRYSLDRTKLIIEGCWQVDPSRELLVSLLSLSVTASREAVEDSRGGIALSADASQREINRAYVDGKLRYSIFAPGERVEVSAAACRAYLQANSKDWESEEP
jgi:hypothetical protein